MTKYVLFTFVSLGALCYIGLYECADLLYDDNNRRENNNALVMVETEDDDHNFDDQSAEADANFLSSSTGMFKPTKQWQKVKPGQMIPQGLHVRLNLETGDREAKLLDEDETSHSSEIQPEESSHLEQMKKAMEDVMKNLETGKEASDELGGEHFEKSVSKDGILKFKNQHITREELKQALKNFKVSPKDAEKLSDASKKFRTIEEIRKEFKELNMDMKTDLELLTETLQQYRNEHLSVDRRRIILADLEYLLHQIDNAQYFGDMGGFPLTVADLNSTVEEIRSSACLVITSAVQSNPKVQVSAVEAGVMQQLIRMLSTDSSVTVRSRSLTALSSLIRHFPYAQRKFIELGGLQTLSDLLVKHSSTFETDKLCLKAVTLVADLLNEQITLLSDDQVTDKVHEERLRQYAQVPLLSSVVANGWCRLVPKLLGLPEHDSREKVLNLMWLLRDSCRVEISQYVEKLELLRREYSSLSEQESHDNSGDDDVSYFGGLLEIVNNVMGVAVTVAKDEF